MNAIRNILALFLIAAAMAVSILPASAHDADCPFCKLKLVQNTDKQDNEVVVKFGNKRIEYRCVYCVFADQKRYKTDLIVYAPSEKVGEPIVLKRTGGAWSAPDGTVFLNTFKKHKECAGQSRAFRTKAALESYAKANGIENAKPLTLKEMLDVAK